SSESTARLRLASADCGCASTAHSRVSGNPGDAVCDSRSPLSRGRAQNLLIAVGLRAPPENLARSLEVGGRIGAARHAPAEAHARLERAQLLELLALLQRRGGERDETRQRGAAKGVKPDVVIERALARGRRRAGEIERAQAVFSDRGADELHHVRVAALLF